MSDSQLLPVMCLLGPTASGKTDFALALSQRYQLELISVDSAQVYRQMDVGTAKPDAETLLKYPHALIDIIDPWQHYSVARFISDVDAAIEQIHKRGNIPLLVGGTMLYYRGLWDGLSDLPKSDAKVRQEFVSFLQANGQQALYEKLKEVDPDSAARIHSNDPQRVMRALEVYKIAGAPLSSLQRSKARDNRYHFYNIGLFPQDRKILHARIEKRFQLMLDAGFEQEVQQLMTNAAMHAELPSMRCVGYRQMWQYLSGECDRREMIDKGVAATRQLAKRQITWLRGMDNCRMIDPFEQTMSPNDAMLDDTALANWVESAQNRLQAAG